jgi:hypothetical protein
MAVTPTIIRPQTGPQEKFLSSSADIAIYGGAAGGGKSWALLLEPLRHVGNSRFGAVFFRRTMPQIKNEGGLWDESAALYLGLSARPNSSEAYWTFPSGASISFSHLEHNKSVSAWQGAQIPLICFDELTHFTSKQFWYMLSRNRSTCGIRPYVRATCNPDPDSFVRDLIKWWVDQETGLPIPSRSGVVRWFVRVGDELHWGDLPSDLAGYLDSDGNSIPPKSLTFIAAKLTDNKALMNADPGYMANLMAMDVVERERLLGGNWAIKSTKAAVFSKYRVEAFDDPKDAIYRFGADWGFANDPAVLVKCYIHGRELRVKSCISGVGVEIDATPDMFDRVSGSRQYPIRADSARPEIISYMRRKGFKMVASIKGAGSIIEGVTFLKGYDIVIHPDCDPLLLQEIEAYSFDVDPLTGDILPTLADKFNNTIDALRYACEMLIRTGVRPSPISESSRPSDYKSHRRQGGENWKTI